LTLSQDSVTVEVGSSTKVLATAAVSLAGGHLRLSPDPGIRATLLSQGARQWVIGIEVHAPLTNEGLVTVELLDRKGLSTAAVQLKVVPKARPATETMAQAVLVLDGDDVVEGRSLEAFVTVTNRSDQNLAVGKLRPIVPAGIAIEIGTPLLGLIGPRQVGVQPITIKMADDASWSPGKHVVGIAVPLHSPPSPDSTKPTTAAATPAGWSGELIATQNVTLTVPGVSALEGVLQVPSLLLLPGLLAVVAFSAILDFAKPRPLGEDPLNRLAIVFSPGLWVLMILVSAAIGFVYAWVSGREILYVYAMRDLVWLSAIALSIGGLVGIGALVRERRLLARAAAPRFPPDLEPLALLAQLVRENQVWRLTAKQQSDAQLFLLGPGPDPKRVWACARIDCRFAPPHDPTIMGKVRQAIQAQNLDDMREQTEAQHISLSYSLFVAGAVQISAPQLVAASFFKEPVHDAFLVQEAV
jgi:hypothetical protein